MPKNSLIKLKVNRRTGRARRALLAASTALVLAVSLAACGGTDKESAGGKDKEAGTVGVAYYPGVFFSLPAFVAQEEGLFSKNGIDTKLSPFSTGPAMTTALIQGEVAFTNSTYDQLAVARSNDMPVKAVIGNYDNQPLSLIVRSDLPLPHLKDGFPTVLKDLIGKRWGVTALGTSTQFTLQKLLTAYDYKADSVTFVAAGLPPTALAALSKSEIDTFWSFDPLTTTMTASGKARVVYTQGDENGPANMNALGNAWWSSDSIIAKRPETVSAFQTSIETAICWSKDPANIDRLTEIALKYVPLPDGLTKEDYVGMLERDVAARSANVSDEAIKQGNQLMVDNGVIKKAYSRSELVAKSAPTNATCS